MNLRFISLFPGLLFVLSSWVSAESEPIDLPPLPVIGTSEEIARFAAPEARQGVAVDEEFIYVIGNHVIGKYRKDNYARVGGWSCPEGEPLIHLNAGIILDGLLYTAHSNYPETPMLGSVEVFDPKSMTHLRTHSFGMGTGSTTWIERRDGSWYACFAHYANRAAEPNRDPTWTQLVRFDDQWRRLEGWAFPKQLLARFGKYSSSGGAFGPGGYLYATGHDDHWLYVLAFPQGGSRLVAKGKIPVSLYGQAFAWDPTDGNVLYGIIKADREVVIQRVVLDRRAKGE